MKINLNPFHNPLFILTKLLLFLPRKKSFLKEQQVYSYSTSRHPLTTPRFCRRPCRPSSFLSSAFFPLSRGKRKDRPSKGGPGVGTWCCVHSRTFPSLHLRHSSKIIKEGGGSISLRVAGWPTPHPWQARAKQMSHCHAKGSPLACNVFRDTLHVPSFACWKLLFFFFRKRGQGGG